MGSENTASFYDGTKLLSLNDANGKKPEIFICSTNRSAGKTTYFNRLVTRRFFKTGEKFMLVFRFGYEVDGVAEKFFSDIRGLFFPNYRMTAKNRSKGVYQELFIAKNDDESIGESCGYAVALNQADAVKRFSHLFNAVGSMLFDEFQSETGKYAPGEVDKLISLHMSVARGNGKQIRYVPIYMLSNAVSLINPYYVALGISNRLNSKTRFLRGDGYVVEQGYVESAAVAQKESGFNRAFSSSKYVDHASENLYLNDNAAFIEKMEGRGRYLATVLYDGVSYGIRSFDSEGIVYMDNRPDVTYPDKITVTVEDHRTNYVMLMHNSLFIQQMRYFFEKGCFRFRDLKCKEAALRLLSY